MKYGEDNESEVHWSEDRKSSGMRMRENTRNIKKTYLWAAILTSDSQRNEEANNTKSKLPNARN